MDKIIGREKEQKLLLKLSNATQSVFLAIYGRRRVGKTYLVRSFFNDQFDFYASGLSNVPMSQHLANFHQSLIAADAKESLMEPPNDWFEAFRRLTKLLINSKSSQKRIFIDELPWLDTPKSNFIPALEYFWNTWASARTDIMLIVCGSAASWMISNLINHKGGLHNRVTDRIELAPFTLEETAQFFVSRGAKLNYYQVLQIYMVMGGIPFYLNKLDLDDSMVQNVNRLCFEADGAMNTEFNILYQSLFQNAEKHITIVKALAKKNKGLTRAEIAKQTGLPSGGSLTRILDELERSNFVRSYNSFGHKKTENLYQLIDLYSLFYLKFIDHLSKEDSKNWINGIDNPKYKVWAGYAFELLGLIHINQIKKALGIEGVETSTFSWLGKSENKKAQIDLVIDRRDQVVSICEFKFSTNQFTIDKKYAENLQKKIEVFRSSTKTKKAIQLAMITTYGLKPNSYSNSFVQKDLKMDIFFE